MRTFLFILVTLMFMCTGCSDNQSPGNHVIVGSKKFTESVVLAEIVSQLARESGVEDVEHRQDLGGTRVLWSALVRGDIDIYPEYTGTIREEILADRKISSNNELKSILNGYGIEMSSPLGFDNTYAIGMKEELAEKLAINKISDLIDHPELKFGFNNEFMDRNDGWRGLQRAYGLPQKNVTGLDHDLAYLGVESGDIDVMDLYTTDAEIKYHNLRVLEDDLSYFPEYMAVLLYRKDFAAQSPDALNEILTIEGKISAKEMIDMNTDVKIGGKSSAEVASRFLQDKLSIDTNPVKETFLGRLYRNTIQHLFLVLVSLSAAILISIPLGIAAFRYKSIGSAVLGVVGIIQTIPSLALLVFMIPFFGIGTVPAIVALFLYSLLPIVRNTYSGLQDIPNDVRESAEVLGLSSFALLRLIELPLASRSILSGIKTSAVINVGTATLGALIGAGGYGQPILTGIRLDNMGLILEGAVPAAILALLVQGFFDLSERVFIPAGLRSKN